MRKKLLLTSFILLTCIALIRVQRVNAQDLTFAVEPDPQIISAPGQTAKINITVANSIACVQWVLNLTWDPSYVDIASAADIVEGPWLKGSPPKATMFLVKPINHAAGSVQEITCLLMDPGTASGNGVLLTVTFTGVAQGVSEVNMELGLVLDADTNEYPADLENGAINVVPEFSFILLPVFLTVTAIAIAASTIRSRNRRGPVVAQ